MWERACPRRCAEGGYFAGRAALLPASGLCGRFYRKLKLQGHTVLFATAGQWLGELASLDSDSALRYRLRRYAAPDLLVIDEVGYLSYSNRHADLLFELINRRHEKKSTLLTTNKSFSEWSEVFPSASCVVAMIDRLVQHAEILSIKGDSYRRKEAQERAVANARKTKALP